MIEAPSTKTVTGTGRGGLEGSATSFFALTSQAPPHTSQLASTLMALPENVVDGGEIVLLAVKPSLWKPVFESAPWIIVCSLLAVLLALLGRPLPGLSISATAQMMLLIAFTRLGLAVVRWVPAWYVLTNRRVITIRGVRAPRITANPLIEIRNSYLHASPSEKLARLGTITFVTDRSNQAAQFWCSIAKSDQIHAKVRRAIENAIDHHQPTG